MPADALPIPDDLVALQQDSDQARAAADDYADRTAAVYRERYPDPVVDGRPKWSEEQALQRRAWTEEEHTELNRLRDAARRAVVVLYQHPTLVQAREGGSAQQTLQALKEAARGGTA